MWVILDFISQATVRLIDDRSDSVINQSINHFICPTNKHSSEQNKQDMTEKTQFPGFMLMFP